MRRLPVVLTVLAGALAAAGPAQAGIWTPVNSGTTEDITAVDMRGPGDVFVATGNGKILRNGTQQLAAAGVSFTGIALNPSGTVGLATANGGRLYRTTNGTTWTQVAGLLTRTPGSGGACSGSPSPGSSTVTGTLVGVAWKDDTTAYVPSSDEGVVLKTTNGGASWIDVSRQADGTCRAGTNHQFTDVATVAGSDVVYVLDQSFGGRWISGDGLASPTTRESSGSVNCYSGVTPHISIDPTNASRSWVVGGLLCTGGIAFGFSGNSGLDYDQAVEVVNGDRGDLKGLGDVSAAGGSALAAGNAGFILVSLDGPNSYLQRADGVDATTDWVAVDKSSAGDAAVGGRGGRLVVSNQANAIPDLVKPGGTVTGPATVVAGTSATYTANVADNAGGSGINPGAFSWSATGLPAATGNPVSLKFPSAGTYTVRVQFADNAGNAGEATLTVRATTATTPPLPPKPPTTKPPSKTVTKTVTVAGGTVTLGVPRACVPVGTSFTATLSFKRSKKKGTRFVKVSRAVFTVDGQKKGRTDKKAPFRQTISVKALKAGKKYTLRARATIKVKKGKSPKKSITRSFTVCG